MKPITPYSLYDFLDKPIPPRNLLFGNWCKERTAILVSGQAGAGKSFFVETLALSISSNKSIFNWNPRGTIKVGLFDGENDDEELQTRLSKLAHGLVIEGSELQILTRSSLEFSLGRSLSLSDSNDQELIINAFKECQIIIVDNLNCCFDLTDENSTKDWNPVQQFIFKVRKYGKSIILVHHTPKSNPNSPAGNSKNVRVFDYSFLLTRLNGASNIGAEFYFTIHKARGNPKDLAPFKASLREVDNDLYWDCDSSPILTPKDETIQKAIELSNSGKSTRDISEVLGISKSKVSRIINDAKTFI